MPVRLRELRDGLVEILQEARPGVVSVERPFLGRNPQTALAIGMARAVALLTAADLGSEVHEYTPAMVKKAVVGRGGASKEQVAAMVRVILGIDETPRPADATDALAVALAHAHRAPRAAG